MQDDILRGLMYKFDPERPRASRSDALLVDDSVPTAFSSDVLEIPVDRVPGGTISYIFERFSATIEKENDGEPGEDGSS